MSYHDAIMAEAPPSGDLVSFWELDDSGGSPYTLADEMSANAGTYQSAGVTYSVAAKSGNGVTLNGTTGYAIVPHSTSLTPTGNFSLECWLKTTSASNLRVVNKYNTSTWAGYALAVGIVTAGKVGLFVGSGAWVSGATAINDGNWHHVVATYDGTNAKIYLDGNQTPDASEVRTAVLSNTGDFYLGTPCEVPGSGSFDGSMDALAIYSEALTSQQVADHYNAAATLVSKSSSDSVSCAEGTPTILRSSTSSDSGTLVEGTPVLLRDSTDSDAVSCAEGTSTLLRDSTRSDSGTLAEGTSTLLRSSTDSDTGTFADSGSVFSGLEKSDSDAGTFAEGVSTLSAVPSASDSGVFADLTVLSSDLSSPDSGSATDSASVAAFLVIADSDSGTFSELTPRISIAAADSGSVSESRSLGSSFTSSDSAIATESVIVMPTGFYYPVIGSRVISCFFISSTRVLR